MTEAPPVDPAPSPAPILDVATSMRNAKALLVGARLGVFTHLANGRCTAAYLGRRCGVRPGPMACLLDALVAMGFLEKDLGTYQNTQVGSCYLVDGSPASLLDYLLLMDSRVYEGWHLLLDALRSDEPVGRAWTYYDQDAGSADVFARAMFRFSHRLASTIGPSLALDGSEHVVDIGGGAGGFALALAESHPQLEADIVDFQSMEASASRNIEAAGLSDRARFRVHDVVTGALPQAQYDVAVVSQMINVFSDAEVRAMLDNVAGAVKPGGRIVVVQRLLGPGGIGPLENNLFALSMLLEFGPDCIGVPTEEQVNRYLDEAGFAVTGVSTAPVGFAISVITGVRS